MVEQGTEHLAQLMAVAGGPDAPAWASDDLAAMFAHQMRSPLLLSRWLEHEPGEPATGPHRESDENWLTTWEQLLSDPEPSFETLDAAKQFAKSNMQADASLVPPELATALYYALIAAGLVRLDCRLSRLDDAALSRGFTWGLDQAWVSEPVTGLLKAGLRWVDEKSNTRV